MRNIVIHHTHLLSNINNILDFNDLLFFDDCLYSQYVYIKNNINFLKSKNISIILGLSPKLIRLENQKGIFIESNKIHDIINKYIHTINDDYYLDVMNGFMTLSEIKELLTFQNIKLGLHGCCHLKLEHINNNLDKIILFNNDVKSGLKLLNIYNLYTNIFIYPYEFKLSIYDNILKKYNFKYIYGGNNNRIYIEDLINNQLA